MTLPSEQSSRKEFPSNDPFEGMSPQLRDALWGAGHVREFTEGSEIWPADDSKDKISFLVEGCARVLLVEPDGPAIQVEELLPGDVIGEIGLFTDQPAPFHFRVEAAKNCRLLEIPISELESLLKQSPDCALSIMRSLARKVIRLDRTVYNNVRKKRALQALISKQEHLFPDYFVGETVRRRTSRKLEELAAYPGPILITGETGVGKEFMAHAIFGMSPHYKRVFLCLDMLRPLPQTSVAGDYCELPRVDEDPTDEQMRLFFGSEIVQDDNTRIETPGYLELTEDGTLLVRGIEQLTPTMQRKLIETLTTGTFQKVGSRSVQTCNFRLIGTTNLDISEVNEEKHPLLAWLADHSLNVPPLRKRRKEIPALIQHYVNQYSQELHKEIHRIPKETIKTLLNYSWPGNDRELATTLKRAVLLAEDGIIRPQDIYFDLRRIEADGKVNLMRLPSLRAALKSPLFPAIFQSMAAPFFFILLVLLFLGPADPRKNLGGLFSWAIGWPTMIFGAFFWARFWCTLCPMGTLSHLSKKIVSYNIPFPPWLKHRSDWIISASALFIIWLETATDMRSSPFNTGLLLLTILALATIVSVIFERQSWCRYLCPLGGMMGVFAKVSPIELRADRNVCASQCTTNDCYVGTKDREGCPFGQMAPTLRSNRFCKLCANCVKNCPHDAINLSLRVPGREIWEMKQVGYVTAFLVISLFAGLMSELARPTVAFDRWSELFSGSPRIVVFTLFFLLCIASANALVFIAAQISRRVASETTGENFARYGLALLPLVLTSYMAFHLYYLVNLGVYLPIVLWQTFQFELLRQLVITVPPSWVLAAQRFLIVAGAIGSMVIMYRFGRARHSSTLKSLQESFPHGLIAALFSFLALKTMYEFFS
uniref:Cyclic nucleotide-binding domain-containing protein n=1 Tax=Desulfomonile tiedjei TaxID=2358 RepID=A0A7C4ESX0_9BACT